jgi:acyl-CoA hydrolase
MREVSMPECQFTKVVMPNQANSRGSLFGGALLAMMDEAAAIAAMRHARHSVVTAHMNSVDFKAPILQGQVVRICAQLVGTGRTSMTLQVEAYGEDLLTGREWHCTSAEVVMVAMDEHRRPTAVPPFQPTDETAS